MIFSTMYFSDWEMKFQQWLWLLIFLFFAWIQVAVPELVAKVLTYPEKVCSL